MHVLLDGTGFEVTTCDGGGSLRRTIAKQRPDLIVLDLNMPEEDGLSIIRTLKQQIAVPIIMLTATSGAIDRIVGLKLGADDYLAKPCELRELLARIRSVLRRSVPAAAGDAAAARRPALVRFGTKWLDLQAQLLRDDRGNEFRSPAPSSPCSRSLPKIQSACCPASNCSTWPMRVIAKPSTARSTYGSPACGARSSRIRLIRRSFARCGEPAIYSLPPARRRNSSLPRSPPRCARGGYAAVHRRRGDGSRQSGGGGDGLLQPGAASVKLGLNLSSDFPTGPQPLNASAILLTYTGARKGHQLDPTGGRHCFAAYDQGFWGWRSRP